MSRLSRFAPVFLLLTLWPSLMLWPALAWAQTAQESARGVGVVTTLAGRATVARAALAEPQPLRFKDDVFVRDRIATAEKSIVRVLLGGKALVTVRELSALTITEEAGRSTVDLRSGKIAMGVVRQRMRPGEVIEIRTPNAIAAIRGTVLVVELIPEPGSGSAGAPRYTTKVHVLHGLVEVSDPNNPGAPPAQVGTLESWSRTGGDPSSLAPLAPAAAEQVFADLRSAPQIAEGPREFMASVMTREQAKAVAVAEFLAPDVTGGGDSGGAAAPSGVPSNGTSTVMTVPVSPDVSTAASDLLSASAPLLSLTQGALTTQGSLVDLSGTAAVRLTQVAALTASSLSIRGHGVSLSGSASLTVTGDLFRIVDGRTLTVTNGALLSLSGASALNVGGALINFVGAGNTLSISNTLCGNGGCTMIGVLPVLVTGGGSISLSNPILNLTGNTLTIAPGAAVITVSGSSQVRQGQ